MSNLKRSIYQLFNQLNPYGLIVTVCCTIAVLLISVTVNAQPVIVRTNRWLELRNFSGTVDVLDNSQWYRAQSRKRLDSVGDGVRTGPGSLARLAIDTGIGFVSVSENTNLRVTDLATTRRGGKVTRLDVSRGQARAFVRPFNNPDSRFEIRTPASVNGVRGTEFGILTQPDGRRTLLAVREGSVICSAQGESTQVYAGSQTLTILGQLCNAPEPLQDEPSLSIFRLERRHRQGRRAATMVNFQGQISPYNLLLIDGETQETDREGNFDLLLPLPASQQSQVKVITPLGTVKIYELVIP